MFAISKYIQGTGLLRQKITMISQFWLATGDMYAVQILSPVTDNCTTSITGREVIVVEIAISFQNTAASKHVLLIDYVWSVAKFHEERRHTLPDHAVLRLVDVRDMPVLTLYHI